MLFIISAFRLLSFFSCVVAATNICLLFGLFVFSSEAQLIVTQPRCTAWILLMLSNSITTQAGEDAKLMLSHEIENYTIG